MGFRDFDAEAEERARERDPIRFRLGGADFTARPVIPFGAQLDLAAAPELRNDPVGAAAGLVAFLQQVVAEDQVPLVEGAVRAVDLLHTHDVVRWLGEEYSGRPTVRSSVSAVSPPAGGPLSSSEPPETDTEASAA